MKWLIAIAVVALSLFATYHCMCRIDALTGELDTVKSQLAAEIEQRERLGQLRLELDMAAEGRRKDSEDFRRMLEGADDEEIVDVLGRTVPDSVLRGLRSVQTGDSNTGTAGAR